MPPIAPLKQKPHFNAQTTPCLADKDGSIGKNQGPPTEGGGGAHNKRKIILDINLTLYIIGPMRPPLRALVTVRQSVDPNLKYAKADMKVRLKRHSHCVNNWIWLVEVPIIIIIVVGLPSFMVGGMTIEVIPMDPNIEKHMITAWSSAVELRNGDRYYISNRTQQAVINYNFYVFHNFNLFYYSKREGTTTFIGSIPTHMPKGIALVPNSITEDGVDEGNELLVFTDSCILSFDIQRDPLAQQISVEAGNCYESGWRDGPKQFARFNSLLALAVGRKGVWMVADHIVDERGNSSRLCLIHNNLVMTLGKTRVFPQIHTISMSLVEKNVEEGQGEIFLLACWPGDNRNGMAVIWIPQYTIAMQEVPVSQYKMLTAAGMPFTDYRHFSQIIVNAVTLSNSNERGFRLIYAFTADTQGHVMRSLVEWQVNNDTSSDANGTFFIQQNTVLRTGNPLESIISLYVDFPNGVFLAEGNMKTFLRVNTLGCVCPPGYALAADSSHHCQIAPVGGYVDIMGNFIACPPGTFEDKNKATSRMACKECPPFKVARYAQSVRCELCLNGSNIVPHTPEKTECLRLGAPCPPGSITLQKGSCQSCPPGSSSSADRQSCTPCPPHTYSNPSKGVALCTACPKGKASPHGNADTCYEMCPSGCAPRGIGQCWFNATTGSGGGAEVRRRDYVLTISVVGIKAVSVIAAQNGTVYVAGFQLLSVIDRSGSSINIPLDDFTMVQGLALSQEEGVLFAAIMAEEILCFTFVGTAQMKINRVTLIPGAVIVALSPLVVGQDLFLAHDTASNSLLLASSQPQTIMMIMKYSNSTPFLSPVYEGGKQVIVSALWVANKGLLYILLQSGQMNTTTQKIVVMSFKEGAQSMLRGQSTQKVYAPPSGYVINQHLAFWEDMLICSVQNAMYSMDSQGRFALLAGVRNISGREDSIGESARFVTVGPMFAPSNTRMLLVMDQTALRVVYAMGGSCLCDKDFYLLDSEQGVACVQCPQGMLAMPGTVGGCSNCDRGQYYDAIGRCVPCPRITWWKNENGISSCPSVIDTMVARDTTGLTMMEIFMEMSEGNPQHSAAMNMMAQADYVSKHTIQIPLNADSVLQDDAARGRFWVRSKRITPPPLIFLSTSPNTPLADQPRIKLPGFWIVCSKYVLQTETCSCDLPKGGIKLGSNDDMTQLWNKARAQAAAIDYATLLITLPPDPDLYIGGGTEYIHFMNISVSPTSLFVSRTDAGGGVEDDNPAVIFLDSVVNAMQVPLPTPPDPTPSESSFAACIAGWPATYSCMPGFLWVAPLYTCVPCKPGFFYSADDACHPCSIGSYSALEGSTTCIECASARVEASSACLDGAGNASIIGNASGSTTTLPTICRAGFEERVSEEGCMPCIPGFFKGSSTTIKMCSPCPPGSFASNAASTVCTGCATPLVSTQWGSTTCIACAAGYVPMSSALDGCKTCNADTQYFKLDAKRNTVCIDKVVLTCKRGYYMKDGGNTADNQCVACVGCSAGEVMTPYTSYPCNDYEVTTKLGAPYTCVPVQSIPGLFARLGVSTTNLHNFTIQYIPCEGLPPFAQWSPGPDPTLCFFQCNYAISEAGARQYAYYYWMEQGGWSPFLSSILSLPPQSNLFLLDYPGLSRQLMPLSLQICLTCPKTQCPWGKFRPIIDTIHGCGGATCSDSRGCQVVPGGVVTEYAEDGCSSNCNLPANAYLTGLSLPGTGDNCRWICKLGFFRETVIEDSDTNETMDICTSCSSSACNQGAEFIPSFCLANAQPRDFCIACPVDSRGLAVLSSNTPKGVCKYDCVPGVAYTATGQQGGAMTDCIACKSSNASFCAAGFRRICAVDPCVPCPKLPSSIWTSAVTMPSNTDVCQAACKAGYHTLIDSTVVSGNALLKSYDPKVLVCALCSLRPSIPCTSSNTLCANGYYFVATTRGGICKLCPTVYDCGIGFSPSSCICTMCRTNLVGGVFIHQRSADELATRVPQNVSSSNKIVADWGTCPAVCPQNSVIVRGVCTPCSTITVTALTPFTAFYSVWNASNGVRWWDAGQDPIHLAVRPLQKNTEERRAGLCWPCPPGTFTASDDTDLCNSVVVLQQTVYNVPSVDMSGVILTSSSKSQGGVPKQISSIIFKAFSFLTGQGTKQKSSLSTVTTSAPSQSQAGPGTLRRRALLSVPAVHPRNGLNQQHAHANRISKGIRVHRHHKPLHPSPSGPNGMIFTCPQFAVWDAHHGVCVCMEGFQRPHQALSDFKCIRNKRLGKDHACASSSVTCPPEKYKDPHGICRLCPFLHRYDTQTGKCEYAVHDATALHVANTLQHHHAYACPKGFQRRMMGGGGCEACPMGTFSNFKGLSPCMQCPLGTTTLKEGAEKLVDCVKVGVEKDEFFVNPQSSQFYLQKQATGSAASLGSLSKKRRPTTV